MRLSPSTLALGITRAGSGTCAAGAIVDPALELGVAELLETWLGPGLGLLEAWPLMAELIVLGLAAGLGLGVGVLGALLCDELAAAGVLEELLAGLLAGVGLDPAGAGCCAWSSGEINRTLAITRPESRMEHLLTNVLRRGRECFALSV